MVHQSRLRDLRRCSRLQFRVEQHSPLSIVAASSQHRTFCVASKHFSVAQIPVRFRLGRIQGLLRLRKTGLLPKAPIEPDEHLSMHPALRVDDMTVDKTVPLAWLVAKFTGSHRSTGAAFAKAFAST